VEVKAVRRLLQGTMMVICLASGVGMQGLATSLLPVKTTAAAEGSVRWPQITLNSLVTGLNKPVAIANAGDGSGRLFVVEQEGRIRIIKHDVLQRTPFLDIHDRVGCCGERGLLSVAFPPGDAGKGYFYVDYTDTNGDTMVARFRITANPDVADPDSEEAILFVDQPYPNHNGGQLAFGLNDGYLYIGMGDGGSAGDPQNRAQNPEELLGKILRIDVESEKQPYAVPPGNPYTRTTGYRGEIWALGLRNPWRFSFDRQTADLYIGDVGQSAREEIDFQPATSPGGENYGWHILEGTRCYNPPSGCVLPDRYSPPAIDYDRSGGNCAVTGGFVYRGPRFPRMRGVYFYADYCSGRIWGLKRAGGAWQNALLYEAPFTITSFGEDEAGTLYLTDYSNGAIYALADTTPYAQLYLPLLEHTERWVDLIFRLLK